MAQPEWVGLDTDSWGLDHGTWSVLVHAFPQADVPVVQLSINAFKPLEYHLALGARLAPLRDRGILIVGSGDVVHNLGRIDFSLGEHGFPWAHRFDDAARALMTTAPGDILGLQGHPDFALAVPTPDHFIPLLYLAALAGEDGSPCDVAVDGYMGGSVSMTAYTLGVAVRPGPGAEARAGLADPPAVPPEDTNM